MNNRLPHSIPQEFLRMRLFAHDGVTSDAVAVFKKIMNLTSSVLRNGDSGAMVDTATLVRECAEVWIKFPEVFSVRQRMADALDGLANLLQSAGDRTGARQARWCAFFACSRDIESGRVIHPTSLDFRI
jgi:hypothetical protein